VGSEREDTDVDMLLYLFREEGIHNKETLRRRSNELRGTFD